MELVDSSMRQLLWGGCVGAERDGATSEEVCPRSCASLALGRPRASATANMHTATARKTRVISRPKLVVSIGADFSPCHTSPHLRQLKRRISATFHQWLA